MHELTHDVYLDASESLALPQTTDMSRSNACHLLTLTAMEALQLRGLPVQREFHEDSLGNWHYLIAHKDECSMSTQTDIVTDFNPWQWRSRGGVILHGPRSEVMGILESEGAPDFFVTLRSIETIALTHDTRKFPVVYSRVS